MDILNIDGKAIELFPSRKPGAPLVLLNGEAGEGRAVVDIVRTLTEADFALAAVSGLRWNDELTPWPAPPIARRREPSAGQADEYIGLLTGQIVPAILAELPEKPAYIAITGYSLAGLFALYALYRTDAFARAASASGSLWYPGFVEYARTHAFARRPDRLYISLGDREGRTRNPIMRPVEENTRILAEAYRQAGLRTILEMNPGGHFNEPDRRTARAIAWMLDD